MNFTYFSALTSAMGDAMAMCGGARQTRITRQSKIGDTVLHVERGSGLPEPGLVSAGRLTYSYEQAQPNQLTGIRALVGGASMPGVLAVHQVGDAVLDVSQQWSELDALRAALFVDTATGEDLAILGRSLGVPRNEALADDAQYRAIIKALAYARRGTTQALTALLDALLGKGQYEMSEDPFNQPGRVIVTVPPTALTSKSSLGKSYTAEVTPLKQQNGQFRSRLPAFGHGALVMSPLDLRQTTTSLRPSESSPAGVWTWSGSDEKGDVQILADAAAPTPIATLVRLNGNYQATAPALSEAAEAEMSLVARVVRPEKLGAAGTLGGQLVAGGYVVTWVAQAQAGVLQIALASVTYSRLSPWVDVAAGYHAIALRLNRHGARLLLDGVPVGAVRLAVLDRSTDGTASFGNLSLGAQGANGAAAPQMAVRFVQVAATPTRDRWQGEGRDAAAEVPDTVQVPGGAHAARHLGHRFILRGGTASGGRNNGTFEIAEVLSPTRVRLRGEILGDGQISQTEGVSIFRAATPVFTYPQDLSKKIQVTTSGQAATYTIAAILEDQTSADFAAYRTVPIRGTGSRVRLQETAPSAAGLAWRLNPSMVAESGLGYVLSDAGTLSANATDQLLTPYQPLPSGISEYQLPRRHVLGNIIRTATSAFNRPISSAKPIRLLVNPLYAHAPLNALETYLPSAASSGVDVVLRS